MIPHKLLKLILILLLTGTGCDFFYPPTKETSIDQSSYNQIEQLRKAGLAKYEKLDSIGSGVTILIKAYNLCDSLRYDEGKMKIAYDLANGLQAENNHALAANYFYISLREAEKLGDQSQVAKAYRGLGLIRYGMGKWSEAITYFRKSREVNNEIGDTSDNDLLDYLFGLCFYHQGDYISSSSYLDRAELAAEKANNRKRLLEVKLHQNHIAAHNFNDPSVLNTYDSLYGLFAMRNEKVGMCYVLSGKAKELYEQGRFEAAAITAQRAVNIARKLSYKHPLKQTLELGVESQIKVSDFKTATEFLVELKEIDDVLTQLDASTRVSLLSAKYEFEKKETAFDNEIASKNTQRTIFLILSLALGLLAYGTYRSKRLVAIERKRSDDLLENILPEETAQELKTYGAAKAHAHDNVTVVFSDIVNFSGIASKLEPSVLVELLNQYFIKFDSIIEELNLEKIKTIGDAYMYVGGLQGEDKKNAVASIEAAKRMIQYSLDVEKEMKDKFGYSFKFRFGAHTGEVVSGVVGTVKYAFDIWGDNVNVAARMESSSEESRINVSEETFNYISDRFECEYRGEISIKNIGKKKMYFVRSTSQS